MFLFLSSFPLLHFLFLSLSPTLMSHQTLHFLSHSLHAFAPGTVGVLCAVPTSTSMGRAPGLALVLRITFLDDRMGWDVQMFTRSLLRMYLCFSCLVPALDVLIMKHHTLNPFLGLHVIS